MESATSDGRLLTVEEFERLPDDGWRMELVRGRVVREPPAGFRHGSIGGRLGGWLHRFVEERGLGIVLASETGFVLDDEPPTVRAPDVALVSSARIPADLPLGFARFAPDPAVEIVSPSNTWSEIQSKVRDVLDAGSEMVWVVDPASRSITVYRARDEIRLLRAGRCAGRWGPAPGVRGRRRGNLRLRT